MSKNQPHHINLLNTNPKDRAQLYQLFTHQQNRALFPALTPLEINSDGKTVVLSHPMLMRPARTHKGEVRYQVLKHRLFTGNHTTVESAPRSFKLLPKEKTVSLKEKARIAKLICVTDKKWQEVAKRESSTTVQILKKVTCTEYTENESTFNAIFMPEYQGPDLFEYFCINSAKTGKKPLNYYGILLLAYNILRALKNIHDAKKVHLDIKQENIILVDNQQLRIQIIDFGTTRAYGSTLKATCRTIDYISPEILTLDPTSGYQVDYAADIYATGIMFSEMLSGTPISQSCFNILNEMTSKEPQNRPKLNNLIAKFKQELKLAEDVSLKRIPFDKTKLNIYVDASRQIINLSVDIYAIQALLDTLYIHTTQYHFPYQRNIKCLNDKLCDLDEKLDESACDSTLSLRQLDELYSSTKTKLSELLHHHSVALSHPIKHTESLKQLIEKYEPNEDATLTPSLTPRHTTL